MNRPDTESLTDGVTGLDSLSVPPEVKPVVKATPQEALSLKRDGYFGTDKTIFRANPKESYIIDIQAVHDLIGGKSKAESLNIAKKWLKAGGNAESELLGYPNRDGLDRAQTVDVAVAKDGNIVTNASTTPDMLQSTI